MLLKIEQYKKEELTLNNILRSFQGWQAYAKWANTYKLRRIITEKIDQSSLD